MPQIEGRTHRYGFSRAASLLPDFVRYIIEGDFSDVVYKDTGSCTPGLETKMGPGGFPIREGGVQVGCVLITAPWWQTKGKKNREHPHLILTLYHHYCVLPPKSLQTTEPDKGKVVVF